MKNFLYVEKKIQWVLKMKNQIFRKRKKKSKVFLLKTKFSWLLRKLKIPVAFLKKISFESNIDFCNSSTLTSIGLEHNLAACVDCSRIFVRSSIVKGLMF